MNKTEQFFCDIKDKKIAVVGVGVSNTPLIKLLASKGAKVTACDKKSKEELGGLYAELQALGVTIIAGEDYLNHFDHHIIFKTPGMRFDVPQLVEAAKKGTRITSEMEVFFDLCPCEIFGISGSDGKTTTTSIVYEMLSRQGFTCHLGGNIGMPLLPNIENIKKDDICVVELSSFQLHTLKKSPKIAVITNVTPNHLDMHKSMEEYVDAKKNLMTFQKQGDRVVLNSDNGITKEFVGEAKGECFTFSRKKEVTKGYYLKENKIMCNIDTKMEIMDIEDIRIVGMHNVENYMAAMAAVHGYVSVENMVAVAKNFTGVEHRIEFVRELHCVKFYNDSIASSPTRTIAGLNAFTKKVILIAGGYDKKIPFDELGEEIPQKVATLVLAGTTSDKIEKSVKAAQGYSDNNPAIIRCQTIKEAVLAAYQVAKEGDIIILSPACASFDAFPNFMERGWKFKEIVNALT